MTGHKSALGKNYQGLEHFDKSKMIFCYIDGVQLNRFKMARSIMYALHGPAQQEFNARFPRTVNEKYDPLVSKKNMLQGILKYPDNYKGDLNIKLFF